MIYLYIFTVVIALFAVLIYIKFLASIKDIQLNSHRLNALEAELRETKDRLLQAELGLAELAQETEVVQDLKDYNEGVANILNYSRETAKGSK